MNKTLGDIYMLLMKEGYQVAECEYKGDNVYRLVLFYYRGVESPKKRQGASPNYRLRKREFWLEPMELDENGLWRKRDIP